jgi:hypothetical protein
MSCQLQEEIFDILLSSDPPHTNGDKKIVVSFWVHINIFPGDFQAARRNAKIQSMRNDFQTNLFDLDFEKEVTRKLSIEMIKGSINVKKDGKEIWFPDELSSSFLEYKTEKKVEIVKLYLPLFLFPEIGFKIPDQLFRCMTENYKATIECFCNPLEVKLKEYYFLFSDGNGGFFDEDGNVEEKLGGKCSIINPPHVPALIDELWGYLRESFEKEETCFFIFLSDQDLTSINDMIEESTLMLKKDDILLLIFSNKYGPWDELGSGPLASTFYY